MGDSLNTAVKQIAADAVKKIAGTAIQELERELADKLPPTTPQELNRQATMLLADAFGPAPEAEPTSAPGGSWLDDAPAFPSSGALASGEALASQDAPSAVRVRLADMYADVRAVQWIRTDVAPTLTICVILLHNGYTLIGKSACVDPANFDEEKGKTFAFEDALKQLWPLKGFALADSRHKAGSDA